MSELEADKLLNVPTLEQIKRCLAMDRQKIYSSKV